RTEVVLTYDDRYLYVGFVAHGDPRRIRATLSDRDEVFGDDVVGILLDTYGAASWGYFLLANPYGIQADMRFTSDGEDPGFDIVYESEGRITESGYVVEMAIPFTSLRFPDREDQRWRINLYRSLPRSSQHQIAWSPIARDNSCVLCQSGVLSGLQGVRAGGTLEVLPSFVAHRASALADPSDPSSAFRSGDVGAEASLGLRYAFANGLSIEGTYNPDFSQVEADAAQIDVNTPFALRYPERRPFFQEGADLYDTPIRQVYTRSVNAPVVAGKLTGRFGETSVAYVGALDEHSPYVLPFEERSATLAGGESVSNIVRVRRELRDDSYIGALVTDRRMDGDGSGTTVGIDGTFRFARLYVVEAQLVASDTREPRDAGPSAALEGLRFGYGDDAHTAVFDGESYRGRASRVSVGRDGDLWGFDLTYRDVTPTFRVENGFQTRNDIRQASASTGLNFYPTADGIDHLSTSISVRSSWNFDGVRKSRSISPQAFVRLIGQTTVGAGAELGDERFRGVDFEGLGRAWLNVNSAFSDPVSVGFSVSRGSTIARTVETPRLGTGTSASASARIKPLPRLIIEPRFAYTSLTDSQTGDELFSGYIAGSRFAFQFDRRLSVRVLAQYDGFDGTVDVDPLLTYRLDPYSVFYVGSTHDYDDFGGAAGLAETERQVFLKFQYLFRG
ncbi:MAG: DUF5916 domain-containing protein, partial [Gemmatimonadota bacterium]